MIKLLGAGLLLLAAPVLAQEEYRALVQLQELDENIRFTLTVRNQSTVPSDLCQIGLALSSGSMFDHFGTATPPISTNPPVGVNNDGLSTNTTTLSLGSCLGPGQTLTASWGDIDGQPLTSVDVALMLGTDGMAGALEHDGMTWSKVFVVSSTPAPTGEITFTWIPPSLNDDGTPYTTPAGYKLYYGQQPGTLDKVVPIAAGETTYVLRDLPHGTYYSAITAVSTDGKESIYSNVDETIVGPKPNFPILDGGTVVANEPGAYALFQSEDDGTLVPIGTVNPGTPCNGSLGFMDPERGVMYAVPRRRVDFAGDAEAELVFARCSD